jgi:predicted PurR-regulated permease PerM
VLLVEVVFMVLVLSLAALVIPVLSHEWPLLREQLPVLIQKLDALISPVLQAWGIDVRLDVEGLKAFVREHLSDNLGDGAARMLSSLKLGGSLVLAVLGHAVLVPVALYYLLLSWPRLIERLRSALPHTWRVPVGRFLTECDQVMGGYLRGQIAVMVAMACYYSIALRLGGLDLAWPIGIFTGLALCVPYVGFGMGLVLALLAALLQFEPQQAVLLVGGVYALGQLIEGFGLTPRWVGERIGLHPLAVIFALLAFGQLLGFIGVLLALPASAMLLVAGRHLVAYGMDNDRDAA